MEEKIVEIGEYTVRMRCKEDQLEVIVFDALGEEIEVIKIQDIENIKEDEEEYPYINDWDDSDDDDFEDSGEGEGDDDDSHYDDDDFDC